MDLPMVVAEIRDQVRALPVEVRFELHLDGRRVKPPRGSRVDPPEARGSSRFPLPDPAGAQGAILTVAQDAVKGIALADLRVGALPLKLPLALIAAESPVFCSRVNEALGASLREGPLWLERSARTAVYLGRRLYPAEVALPCELEIGSALFGTCSTHGWEVAAVRVRTLTLPDFGATFHMCEMRRAEN